MSSTITKAVSSPLTTNSSRSLSSSCYSKQGKKIITLLCGYRRTGKDSFATDQRRLSVYKNWCIYGPPDKEIRVPFFDVKNVCIAESLKILTLRKLKLIGETDTNWKDFEEHKDKTYITDPENPNISKLYRRWLIDNGSEIRAKDKSTFIRTCIENEQNTANPSKHLIFTDFRFLQEYEYVLRHFPPEQAYIQTVRVFRNQVDIPPFDPEALTVEDDSERGLDHFKTDFLAVSKSNHEEDIRRAKELFPVYKDYILIPQERYNPFDFENELSPDEFLNRLCKLNQSSQPSNSQRRVKYDLSIDVSNLTNPHHNETMSSEEEEDNEDEEEEYGGGNKEKEKEISPRGEFQSPSVPMKHSRRSSSTSSSSSSSSSYSCSTVPSIERSDSQKLTNVLLFQSSLNNLGRDEFHGCRGDHGDYSGHGGDAGGDSGGGE